MQIRVGDLVTCRPLGDRLGLVVAKKMSNEGLGFSAHTRHLLGSYANVYYVFFSDMGTTGPYLADEVNLQQIRPVQALSDEP